ncbi:hypothetical protein [Pseudomonas citronellolis]|uniref:hypothetical protein n=1 Tax=Pseudomonas citronellolis TaxID=53408 RepID=UPI0023E46438|nr:hypothetical protein [Pseudomonas citronellolis]MDF3933105.1 hypothetical protein [Pseudomonas citronellolis]
MRLTPALLISTALLSACTTGKVNETEKAKYDPTTTARIRVFVKPEQTAAISVGGRCEDKSAYKGFDVIPQKKLRTMSVTDLFNIGFWGHYYESIGMTPSWHSGNLSREEMYGEFVIPAGQQTAVNLSFGNPMHGPSCVPPTRVFVPEAGKEYEAYFAVFSKPGALAINLCRVVVQELSPRESAPDAEVKGGVCVSTNTTPSTDFTHWDQAPKP